LQGAGASRTTLISSFFARNPIASLPKTNLERQTKIANAIHLCVLSVARLQEVAVPIALHMALETTQSLHLLAILLRSKV